MHSRTGTTAGESVRGRGTTLIAVLVLVCSAFTYWASETEIGYYRIGPGSAFDTGELVDVGDADRYFPAEGRVLLTTVSLGKATLLESIAGWLDPTVDVIREKIIAPDTDEDELRQVNLGLMDQSKQTALAVAFRELGRDIVTESGAQVMDVADGTPAASTLTPGDTIVAIDGTPVQTHTDAVDDLGARSPGDSVRLTVAPADGGEDRDVDVTLAENPEEEGRAFLGVVLTTRAEIDLPFEIDVRSNEIGGPSAGLAFTLEIIDVLTEGELTGGRTVAATGTIEPDGSVGVVGGVAQKTTVVKESGADVFLVPEVEVELAEKYAGDDLEIVGVETIDDALEALADLGGNGLALPPLEADDGPR